MKKETTRITSGLAFIGLLIPGLALAAGDAQPLADAMSAAGAIVRQAHALAQATAADVRFIADNAQKKEVVKYACGPFHDSDGRPLLGAEAPAIVTLSDDESKGKTLYVRTAPLVLKPVFSYDKLTKDGQFKEGSHYSSANYTVDIFYYRGAHARIKAKNSDTSASCEPAKAEGN